MSDIELHSTGRARAAYLFWRPDHDDRRLQSLHDWYGAGVVVGLGGEPLQRDGVNWFCGKTAAQASYYQGLCDGRAIKQERPLPGSQFFISGEDCAL